MNNLRRLVIFSFSLFILTNVSNAQLRIDPSGNIGMGTNYPNPEYRCHVKGNLLVTNYPESPSYSLRMKVGNGWPGVEMGGTSDAIAFWVPEFSYNKLYAEEYYRVSDSLMKSDIHDIESGLNKIMKLKTYIYSLNGKTVDEEGNIVPDNRREYGFLSQEVEELLTDVKITSDARGVKLMDYDQIIPLLVKGVQEQQGIISSLEQRIALLEKRIENISNSSSNQNLDETESGSKLFQNVPNPFSESTTIGFELQDGSFESAQLLVFDVNGNLLRDYKISLGDKSVQINAREFNAGIYLYSLIVNGVEIDTKRMILTK